MGQLRRGTATKHLRQPLTPCIAAGVPALLEIDIEGARQVRRAVPDALLVFLAPPSWDELVRASLPGHRATRGHRPAGWNWRPADPGGRSSTQPPANMSVKDVCVAAGSLDDGLIGPEHIDGR